MIVFLILFVSFAVTAYLYATRNNNYWKNRGIFYMKPTPFIGNLGPIFGQKASIGEFLRDIYTAHKDHPYVGIFLADAPCLVVRDFDLVSRIFKQDFDHFNDRIFKISKKTDYLGAISLFAIHGKEWKNTRAKLSPIFTTKKQKVIFDAVVGVSEKFLKKVDQSSSINIKELSSCITCDVISDAVLGFDGTAISDPDKDALRKLGNALFPEDLVQGLRTNMCFLKPELMITLGISLFPKRIYDLMRDALNKALSLREGCPPRGDYIDALLELQAKGAWEGNDGEMIVPDNENLAGQLFMFFTAGFETAASAITFSLYEISKYPEIQDRLREEINEAYERHGGTFKYEITNELTYMSKFITECLRKHPPFPFVDRVCSRDYILPGTNKVIEKGTKVMIPMLGLHNDEKYYQNPDIIIPERFDDINVTEVPYFPFGTGPRTCLGMRFAQLMLRVIIVKTLRNYKLTINSKTPSNIRMSPKRFGNTPLKDVFLDVEAIKY